MPLLSELRRKLESAHHADELQKINEEVIEARSLLTNQTHILPTYDQRAHEQNLKRVNEYMQLRRLELKPKARFAFKRTAKSSHTNVTDPANKIQNADAKSHSDLFLNSTNDTTTDDNTRTKFDQISNKTDEYIRPTVKIQSDLHLLNLQGCVVDIRGAKGGETVGIKALQIRNLSKCVILAGRIDGSVMIHDCQDCLFILECRQFRMHSSMGIFCLLSTKSVATIEHCQKIAFGSVDTSIFVQKADADHTRFEFPKVQDFDHISTLTPSPNWHFMNQNDSGIIYQKLKAEEQDAKSILSALPPH